MQSFAFSFLIVNVLAAFVQSADVKWCCVDAKEKQKCDDLKTAVAAEATTKSNTVMCVQGDGKDDCVKKVVNGDADIMSMDGGEIYENADKLYPVTTEVYDANKPDLEGAAYYAVAFVKKDSTLKLSDLKGKKTCHTGAGRSAGWKIPMGYLFSEKYIEWESGCNQYYSAAKFFKQSCVPGVKDKVDDDGKVENLCAICKGTGDAKCSSTSGEPYLGYVGAFKCMVDDAGEVAFAKQSTYDDAKASNLNVGLADEYRLLCKDGTKKAITEYKDCNLGKNPAHAVMTSKKDMADDYATWLINISNAFGIGTSKGFSLFNATKYGEDDLLFKDSTKKLADVSGKTATEFLGEDYIQNTKGLTGCVKSSAFVSRLSWFTLPLILALAFFKEF